MGNGDDDGGGRKRFKTLLINRKIEGGQEDKERI